MALLKSITKTPAPWMRLTRSPSSTSTAQIRIPPTFRRPRQYRLRHHPLGHWCPASIPYPIDNTPLDLTNEDVVQLFGAAQTSGVWSLPHPRRSTSMTVPRPIYAKMKKSSSWSSGQIMDRRPPASSLAPLPVAGGTEVVTASVESIPTR